MFTPGIYIIMEFVFHGIYYYKYLVVYHAVILFKIWLPLSPNDCVVYLLYHDVYSRQIISN